jgi:hypothetical protein
MPTGRMRWHDPHRPHRVSLSASVQKRQEAALEMPAVVTAADAVASGNRIPTPSAIVTIRSPKHAAVAEFSRYDAGGVPSLRWCRRGAVPPSHQGRGSPTARPVRHLLRLMVHRMHWRPR